MTCPQLDRMRGFSMMELLVAVLVLGIGVLGLTGLQVLSLQQGRAALMHGEAVHLAYDIIDRIRANPDGSYAGLAWGEAPPVPDDCVQVRCSAMQMARFDQAMWKCALGSFHDAPACTAMQESLHGDVRAQTGLPHGDGVVSRQGSLLRVHVRWQASEDASPTEITVETQL
jgi:type IV pilus assembly protein PilV